MNNTACDLPPPDVSNWGRFVYQGRENGSTLKRLDAKLREGLHPRPVKTTTWERRDEYIEKADVM